MTDSPPPESAEDLNRRANELAVGKRYPEAEALYRRAIDGDPTLAKAHGNLGTVLRHQGRLDEACASFETSLSLGGSAKVATNLATLLIEQGKLDALGPAAAGRGEDVVQAIQKVVDAVFEKDGALRAGAAWLHLAESQPEASRAGLLRTTLELDTAGELTIVVPNDLDLISPFVLLEQGDWFEDEIHFVRKLLRPGEAAVDVGANFGVYTLAMAKAVGTAGRVVAYEPAATTFAFLSASVRKNALEQVVLVRAALSAEVGEAVFTNAVSPELSGLRPDVDASSTWTERVRTETLDHASTRASGRAIELLKLDAEGEEVRILESGARFVDEHEPLIMAELRHRVVNTALLDKLAELGMALHRLVPGPLVLEPLVPELHDEPFLLNVFACNASRAAKLRARGLLGRAEDGDPPGRAELDRARQTFARDARVQAAPRRLLEAAEMYVATRAVTRPDDRLAGLHLALDLAREALAEDATAGARALFVRVAADLGLRGRANREAAAALEQAGRGELGVALVAPIAEWDAAFAGGASARDLQGSLAEYLLRRRHHSVFYDRTMGALAERLVELGDPSGRGRRVLDVLRRAGR